MGTLTFITGGARSGKSSYALRQAGGVPGAKTFIATAEARDDEMRNRIRRHREERGKEWRTVEAPIDLVTPMTEAGRSPGVVVLDCLTLWVANLLGRGRDAEDDFAGLTAALKQRHRAELFIVANEVGLGIVPENGLARRFRDLAGLLNQQVADVADRVVFMVSGQPLVVKSDEGAHKKEDER